MNTGGEMRIAVITPSITTRANLLEECKESVRKQTYPAEIHAIEIDEQKVGPAILRNKLVAGLPSEITHVAFLDDDDIILPRHLELLSAQAENADVVYSPPTGYGSGSIHAFNAKELPGRNHIGMTSLVRRSMFEKVNGFWDKARFEDWDLWLRILKAGGRFVYVPTPTWTYRQQPDSRNHDICTTSPKRQTRKYGNNGLTLNWWDSHPRRK
jgi:cellulose synthase/poly-beta-1,6-N-acetylglucosamine synthase-like glycosyltransferase